MNPLDVSWSILKDSEWSDWRRRLEEEERHKAAQAEREAAASKVTTDVTGQDPDAAARTESNEAELSRKIQAANEQTRRRLARRQWYLKNLGREPTAEEMAGHPPSELRFPILPLPADLDGDRTQSEGVK